MSRLLLLAAIVAFVLPAPAAQDKDFKLTEAEQKLLDLTNAERKKAKLPDLKADPLLCKAARAHSINMAKQGKVDHHLDDKSPGDRIKEAGYTYSICGENLARGHLVSLADIMDMWIRSPGHRENIFDADFTEIGVGFATDSKGETYYTQVFATPRK